MSRFLSVRSGTASGRPAPARVRRTVAALALLPVLPVASACEAGLQAHTSTQRSVVDGETARVGDIVVRDAHVDSPDDPAHGQGGTAQAFAGIYNNGSQPDTLTAASSDLATSVDIVTPTGGGTGSAIIQPGGGLLLMPGTGSSLLLRGLRRPVYAGQNVSLTFSFQNAGRLTMPVPVQVPPRPAERPTPSPAPGEG